MEATHTKPYIVVKIGGRPASVPEVLDALVSDIGKLQAGSSNDSGRYSMVLVHGGGAVVSELSKKLGLEPRFVAGIRQTSRPEMDVVEMVLAGSVNTRILRRFLAQKIPAVGLSGIDAGLFVSESIDPASDSRTGRVQKVDATVVEDLSEGGYIPVISSVSSDAGGSGALNINADDAAMAIAVALKAERLIYLSDIPGILKNNEVMQRIDATLAKTEIEAGTISGGMIPKVNSSLQAVASGVGAVVIGGFQQSGDLAAFIEARQGTSISNKTSSN